MSAISPAKFAAAAKRVQPRILERDWQDRVIELAKLYGWRSAHFRPARAKFGWATPMIGDPGFPDLVLLKGPRMIVAELKRDRGPKGGDVGSKLTEDQAAWLAAFAEAGVRAVVWRPADWPEIVEALSGGKAATKRKPVRAATHPAQ